MSDTERGEVLKLLGEIGTAIEGVEELLADGSEMGMVQDMLGQYANDGNDPSETTVAEFMAWAEEQGADTDTIQSVVEAYLQSVDADAPDAASVEGLADWLDDQAGGEADDEDGGEEGEEGEDGGDENAMGQEELQDAVETIGTFADKLDTVKDMLTEYREDVDERIETLQEERDELDRRLSAIEDEPADRTLTESGDSDFVDLDEIESGGGGETEHEDVML